jgi:hypothetical protein
MIERCFVISSVVLFLGSTTAFFLFVPLLSIMTVGSMLLGLILMFWLGIQAGTRRTQPSQTP